MSDQNEIENEEIVEDNEDIAEDNVDWVDDLDSDEVSELLGFDLSSEEGGDRSGLLALINSALVSHRRLPLLDVIFDRAARALTTNLRQLTHDNVEVTLDDISSTRFGDYLGSMTMPSVIGVMKSPELDNYAIVTVDGALVYSIVDLLLGGRRDGGTLEMADRDFTQIELALTERVIGLIIEDLSSAFEPLAKASFKLDRIETKPRFAAIAQDASVCSHAKFKVEIEDRGGRISVMIPHATLEPVQKLLMREFIGEAGANEAAWRDHLKAEIGAAELDLHVVLAEREMSIGDIAELEIGQTLSFRTRHDSSAEIRAGRAVIARGKVGRAGEAIAICLSNSTGEKDDQQDEVAA